MKSYKDLEIYKLSYDLAVKVHKVSLKLPQYEMYEEGSQVRKSSKGITSCIAEGYGRKKYKAEFIKFLVYAHASCDETIVHLNFIRLRRRPRALPVDECVSSVCANLEPRYHCFDGFRHWRITLRSLGVGGYSCGGTTG